MPVRYGVRRERNRLEIQKKDTDMTKEELLTKVLCEQMPYGVIVYGNYRYDDGDKIVDDEKVGVLNLSTLDWFFNGIEIKPYLRPMSSMTKSEARDIAKLYHISDSELLDIKVTMDGIDITLDDNFCSYEKEFIRFDEIVASIEIFDYLNAKHFDVRGILPKGLGIAAIGNDNPYKEKGGEE